MKKYKKTQKEQIIERYQRLKKMQMIDDNLKAIYPLRKEHEFTGNTYID